MKFFRSLRYSLLPGNKTTRYVRYAIGEILLVVIGILIAVQINNWNENRKDRFEEREILKQLKEEYTFNLVQLEQKIDMRRKIINAAVETLAIIDGDKSIPRDTLIAKIRFLNIDPTFDPIENNIISGGHLRLIQNEDLRKRLSHWSSDIIAVQEMETQWHNMTVDLNTPFQIELGILRFMEHVNYLKQSTPDFIIGKAEATEFKLGKSSNTPTVREILNHPELESLMTIAIRVNYTANLQSKVLRKRIIEMLEMIEGEFES